MATVAGRPFLELLLRQLHRYGFSRVLLAVGYQKDAIRAHFGAEVYGLHLVYSEEASPLGTGGALRNTLDKIQSDTILVMNGDSYTDIDLARFVDEHREGHADVSVAIVPADGRLDCGYAFVDGTGKLTRFAEKTAGAGEPFLNAGIYLLSRSLVMEIPSGIQTSLESEVLPRWLEQGRSVRAFAGPDACVDIGTPERFEKAQKALANVEQHPGRP